MQEKQEIDKLIANSKPQDLTYDEFAIRYLYIQDKDGNIVPFIRNRAQRHFYQARQESPSDFHLVIKARQEGISTDIQGEMFWKAATGALLGATMANDDDNTAHLRSMSDIFYKKLDPDLNITKTVDNASITSYQPTNAKIRIGTAGGKHKGRGGTYTFFHGSEVALWPDAEKTIAGALQGLAPGGTCIFETTANGAQGWVWATFNKPGKWQIHFYPWWWADEYRLPLDIDEVIDYTKDELECIEIARQDGFDLVPEQIKWRRDKQQELGLLFPQEYPETIKQAFMTTGVSVFGDYNKALYSKEIQAPIPGHMYAAGIDWGQQDDFTALSIMDVNTEKEVYLNRWNKQDWDSMLNRIVEVCTLYQVIRIEPEANSMSMQVSKLVDLMEEAVMEWNVHNIIDAGINNPAPEWECIIFAVTMTNQAKRLLVNDFYRAIHYEGLGLLDIEDILTGKYASMELDTFVQRRTPGGEYTYDHIKGGKSDTVIARILALNAARRALE